MSAMRKQVGRATESIVPRLNSRSRRPSYPSGLAFLGSRPAHGARRAQAPRNGATPLMWFTVWRTRRPSGIEAPACRAAGLGCEHPEDRGRRDRIEIPRRRAGARRAVVVGEGAILDPGRPAPVAVAL